MLHSPTPTKIIIMFLISFVGGFLLTNASSTALQPGYIYAGTGVMLLGWFIRVKTFVTIGTGFGIGAILSSAFGPYLGNLL